MVRINNITLTIYLPFSSHISYPHFQNKNGAFFYIFTQSVESSIAQAEMCTLVKTMVLHYQRGLICVLFDLKQFKFKGDVKDCKKTNILK